MLCCCVRSFQKGRRENTACTQFRFQHVLLGSISSIISRKKVECAINRAAVTRLTLKSTTLSVSLRRVFISTFHAKGIVSSALALNTTSYSIAFSHSKRSFDSKFWRNKLCLSKSKFSHYKT